MKHPILYKRAKTGKIVYYAIVAADSLDGYSYIMKETGQLGTKNPIVHNEHIREGKNIGKSNETTHLQQAESQALSDWNKKRDEGYKSLEDLGITYKGISADKVSLKDVYECPSGHFYLEDCLEATLPQFNTDSSGQAKPMLATDWKKVKSITYPCLIQPKLDGVRCLMVVNFMAITFLSRSGKEYGTLNHIGQDVIDASERGLELPFILDGEIYSDELTFQEIVAAVKKQRPESLKLKFRAYDIINDEDQRQRWASTRRTVEAINSECIQLVDTYECTDEAHAKISHDNWVGQGYEGAMLRMYSGKYGQGQRSRDLLKVKEFDETEYRFIRWDKGQREEDLIAVCETDTNQEFRAKMVGTREQKVELQKTTEGMMTIKHFGLTDEGLPRFPIGKAFRDE